MGVDFVPVVVQGELFPQALKLRAPANMTMAQLMDKIRSRMKVPRTHSFHLVSKSVVAMSRKMSHVYRENRSENGMLHFTCAAESAFGCPVPPETPIQKMFPGTGALPFGAPAPLVDPMAHYHQWLAQHQQQQEVMIQSMTDWILAHHNPNNNGAVYHVVHSPSGHVHMYPATAGNFNPSVEFVVVGDANAPW